jgi:tRNA1Val (adenine37-N6)-methyltransferase
VAGAISSEELTYDALFGGAVRFWQPAQGYRVNVDALLLAEFALPRSRGSAIDLGSGVGAVVLALHHLRPLARVTLLECEPRLAALAEKNLAHAGIDADVQIVDLERERLPRALHGSAELVVSNPPFFEPKAARPAAHGLARRARSGRLQPFLAAAAEALSGKRAAACFAYPARSLEHLLENARAHTLVAKRLRFVHAGKSQPARLCLVELRRARPGGLVIEPPLYEWTDERVPSPELAALTSAAPRGRE